MSKNKFSITWLETAVSTNSYLLERARAGAPHGEVIIARQQTGGRGRRGRTFLSPEGGLYMSVLLRSFPYEDCSVMTAAAAVAFRRALQCFSDRPIEIKWVNDLLIDGRKVAGILAEGVISAQSQLEGMVIGVGVNLTRPPEEVADIACALPEKITCGQAADAMLRELSAVLSEPLADVMAEYRRYSTAIGKKVTVVTAAGEYEAQAVDTDERARLICRTAGGETVVLDSGEIRIKLQPGAKAAD